MPRGGEKQLAAAQTDHGQTIATSWYCRDAELFVGNAAAGLL